MSADTVKLYDQLESKIEYLKSMIEAQDEKIKKLEDRDSELVAIMNEFADMIKSIFARLREDK